MLQHSALLSTYIKLASVFKTSVIPGFSSRLRLYNYICVQELNHLDRKFSIQNIPSLTRDYLFDFLHKLFNAIITRLCFSLDHYLKKVQVQKSSTKTHNLYCIVLVPRHVHNI